MDIDKLFKRPSLPASALKTKHGKLAPVPTSIVSQPSNGDSSSSSSAPTPPAASVTDIPDEVDEVGAEEGVYINPNEEDEDERFFGSGLSGQQEQIAEILDRDQAELGSSSSQVAQLRRQLARFERTIKKNQELRIKYADDPHKFIESEADLDSEILGLSVLTAAPDVLYKEALAHQLPTTLCALLSHENEDIVTSVVKVIEDLTDEDVLDGLEDEDSSEGTSPRQAAETGMTELVKELRANQLIELLASNLDRYRKNVDEESSQGEEEDARRTAAREADEQGVYHIFALLENLVGLDAANTSLALVRSRTFWKHLTALLHQGSDHYLAKAKGKASEAYTQNEAYAAELLAIVIQAASSAPTPEDSKDAPPLVVAGSELGGTNALLESLSAFLRVSPHGDEENEVAQNLFDALCALLSEDRNRVTLAQLEGADLIVLLLSDPKSSTKKKHGVTLLKKSALRLLSYALGGQGKGTQAVADALINAGGLKPLFSILAAVKGKHATSLGASDEEHLLSVLVALLNLLPQESVPRIRLLAKFTEHDYANLDRLVRVRTHAAARLARADEEFERPSLADSTLAPTERTEEQETDHILRLDQGLFALELADYVIGWLSVEDDGMCTQLVKLLRETDSTLQKQVVLSLQTYYYDLGEAPVPIPGAVPVDSPAPNQKEVVVDLVNALLE